MLWVERHLPVAMAAGCLAPRLTVCVARAERRPSRVIVLQAGLTVIVLPLAWRPTSAAPATAGAAYPPAPRGGRQGARDG
jgi:hypothetical protein